MRGNRTTALGAEVALLAACAPVRSDQRQSQRLDAAAARDIDWRGLVRLAAIHRMLPLLAHHVTTGSLRPPPAVCNEITRAAKVSARRSLTLAAELATLLDVFADHRLPVVPLKGPVLAAQLYQSVAARQMDDLDILVGESDMDRVQAILEARGYRRRRLWPAALDRLADARSHHVAMIDTRRNVVVELHPRLSNEPGLRRAGTMTALAPHLTSKTFLGRSVSVLDAESLLVYLGTHGAGHGWSRLGWLATFAELARSGQVRDWNLVRTHADRWDVRRRIQSGLLLAGELFGDALPDDVIESSDSSASVRRANHLLLRGLRDHPEAPLTEFGRLRYLLWLDQDATARAGRCWRTVMLPRASDAMALPLPERLWPLLVAFRPIRITARQVVRIVRQRRAG